MRRQNRWRAAGRIESNQREFTLRTETGFRTEENFRQLAVGRGADGYELAIIAMRRLLDRTPPGRKKK